MPPANPLADPTLPQEVETLEHNAEKEANRAQNARPQRALKGPMSKRAPADIPEVVDDNDEEDDDVNAEEDEDEDTASQDSGDAETDQPRARKSAKIAEEHNKGYKEMAFTLPRPGAKFSLEQSKSASRAELHRDAMNVYITEAGSDTDPLYNEVKSYINEYFKRWSDRAGYSYSGNGYIRSVKNKVDKALTAQRRGEPFSALLPSNSEVIAARICHPDGHLNEKISGGLIQLGRIDLALTPKHKVKTTGDNTGSARITTLLTAVDGVQKKLDEEASKRVRNNAKLAEYMEATDTTIEGMSASTRAAEIAAKNARDDAKRARHIAEKAEKETLAVKDELEKLKSQIQDLKSSLRAPARATAAPLPPVLVVDGPGPSPSRKRPAPAAKTTTTPDDSGAKRSRKGSSSKQPEAAKGKYAFE